MVDRPEALLRPDRMLRVPAYTRRESFCRTHLRADDGLDATDPPRTWSQPQWQSVAKMPAIHGAVGFQRSA